MASSSSGLGYKFLNLVTWVQIPYSLFLLNGDVAKLVNAPDCKSDGTLYKQCREFESLHHLYIKTYGKVAEWLMAAV